MPNTDFEKYGVQVLANENDDAAQTDQGSVDISQMKKGFVLSKIAITDITPANEDTFSEEEKEKIKKALGAEKIPDDEAEKFGLMDHPLHKEHMSQGA
jgi:hypothetical protein